MPVSIETKSYKTKSGFMKRNCRKKLKRTGLPTVKSH